MPKNRFNPLYRKEVFGNLNSFNYRVCSDRPNNGTDVPCVRCVCSDSGCTPLLNSQLMLQAENRRIYNTSRIRSSEFMMNKAAFNVFADRGTSSKFTWNQSSDRVEAGNPKTAIVPTRSNSVRGTKTGIRPGSQAPGGSGVDIKHNSYDRYLLRKKGIAMKTGPYVGDDVDSKAIVNNKVQATNSLGLDCDCPPIIVGRSGPITNIPTDPFSGRAVIWKSPPSQLKDSNGEYNYAYPNAYGVSPNGEIVGLLFSASSSYNPVYWSSSSADALNLSLTDSQDNQLQYDNGVAYSINSKGEIVGCVYNEDDIVPPNSYWSLSTAAYWENPSTPFQKLFNKLEGPGSYFSNALSINSNSEIVGYNGKTGKNIVSFASYWSPETKKTESEFLKNGTIANSINSNGDIVGNASNNENLVEDSYPAYWSRDSKFTKVEILSEINTAGAVSINTKGEIIGIEKVRKLADQFYILNDLLSLLNLSVLPNKGLYWKYYYSKQQQLENLTGPDDCTMPFDIQ